nr:UPF0158 family protein [Paenibacillus soyae]
MEQDEHFYFIAGYTEGGFPNGITWEEHEAEQNGQLDGQTLQGEVRMIPLKITERQLQELVEAYDMNVDGIEHYLNVETGDVEILNTLDMDEEDERLSWRIEEQLDEVYYQVPHKESYEGYEDMSKFADTVDDEKLREKLYHILNGGKKVFRRYKDALSSDATAVKRYYKFVEERDRERILEWLRAESIEAMIERPE